MDWKEDYKRKLISAEEAANLVKSGNTVTIGQVPDPPALCYALCARKEELKDVELYLWAMEIRDIPWYEPGWEDSFRINSAFPWDPSRRAVLEKRADHTEVGFAFQFKPHRDGRQDKKRIDFLFTVVSPPDKHGYCSFGHGIWHKKGASRYAKKVIAEVDANLIRTHGDNLHVSEIDYIVENTSPPRLPLYGYEAEERHKAVAQYVAALVKDGDTLQVGTGLYTAGVFMSGALDDKHDLGIHTEMTPFGTMPLINKGVITGKRKTINPNKIVATGFWPEDGAYEYIDDNPAVEMRDTEYTNDPQIIAAHDNMVAINQALSIDLLGQVQSHFIGSHPYAGPGGQFDFCLGALLSRGGRNITVIPSVTEKGIPTIIPRFEPGSAITIPAAYVDYIVTEYGIASLMGKSQRERANELIAVSHPDFRAELRKEAQKMFYP